jgi:hypothetical protein
VQEDQRPPIPLDVLSRLSIDDVPDVSALIMASIIMQALRVLNVPARAVYRTDLYQWLHGPLSGAGQRLLLLLEKSTDVMVRLDVERAQLFWEMIQPLDPESMPWVTTAEGQDVKLIIPPQLVRERIHNVITQSSMESGMLLAAIQNAHRIFTDELHNADPTQWSREGKRVVNAEKDSLALAASVSASSSSATSSFSSTSLSFSSSATSSSSDSSLELAATSLWATAETAVTSPSSGSFPQPPILLVRKPAKTKTHTPSPR